MSTEAINLFIEREKARLAYEQQAVNAYENIQRTGLHVTSGELKQWINSLGSLNPKEAPTCHN